MSALTDPGGPAPAGTDSPTLAVRHDLRAPGAGTGGAGVQHSSAEPSFGPSTAGHAPAGEASEGPAGAPGYPVAAATAGGPAPDSGDFALQRPAAQPPAGPPTGPETAPGEPDGKQNAEQTGPWPDPAEDGPAPDPRTAEPGSAGPGSVTKLCVACRAGQVDTDGYCENCGHAQPRERDHMERELDTVAAVSDRGLRHHRNEDAFAVSATALPDGSPAVVAIVCDGVSSATRPDEASQAAARAACDALVEALPRGTHPQQAMRDAIVAAAASVNALAAPGRGGDALGHDAHPQVNAPACTIVGAVSAGELLIVGWVGDSRAYWVPDDRSGPSARLTEDDSWAAQMVAAGLMTEAEAYADERAHAITGWLGADAYELDPHTAAFKPDRPGVVVVCTDGLWNYAEAAEEMARVVPADAALRPLHSARTLVGHALDGGGHDNVTVAVLPFAVGPRGGGPS
ncbi:PP2C family protein-serine/threonine phosphatase [Streptomyces sp. NPDC003691]